MIYYLQRQAAGGNWLIGTAGYDLAMLIAMAQQLPAGSYRIVNQDGEVVWMS